jgi:ribosome maturation factor RimP
MVLVDVAVSRHKKGVHIKAVVYKSGAVGLEDCSKVHRAIIPRLDLAFSQEDYSVEVSSPGIDRHIKDGSEFALFVGRGVRCYRSDISGWTGGILLSSDEKQIVLKDRDETITLSYDVIAKAKLDYSYEVCSKE